MVRKKVEKQETDAQGKSLTRAQKTVATKDIIKELLAVKPLRHNELIDEVAKEYVHRHEGEDTENINDVKGRVGSVLDIMKKDGEVGYDGGMYALKSRMTVPTPSPIAEEKPVKKTAHKKKEEPITEDNVVEETAPKKRGRPKKEKAEKLVNTEQKPAAKKKTTKTADKIVTPKVPVEEKQEEKEDEKKEPTPVPVSPPAPSPAPAPLPTPIPVPEKIEEKGELVVMPKAEVAQKNVVMDMSFLFGATPQKASVPPKAEPVAEKAVVSKAENEEPKKEAAKNVPPKTVPVAPKATPSAVSKKVAEKPVPKAVAPKREVKTLRVVKTVKPQTADEKLKESFLKRLRTLSGDYFEYYSIYLLERYSMKNGRRLEGLKISGGDHDGGIDGEIELTDKLGFRETIYIQSKNWDPEKGKEENWVVGETLLQQFIGACACRQAKDGKQHTRGIFMTTSRYTPDAKRILEDMSDKIVGYDGNDLYEAAKECEFGLIKKNGEWALDEKLLSGTKAFFQMY